MGRPIFIYIYIYNLVPIYLSSAFFSEDNQLTAEPEEPAGQITVVQL